MAQHSQIQTLNTKLSNFTPEQESDLELIEPSHDPIISIPNKISYVQYFIRTTILWHILYVD